MRTPLFRSLLACGLFGAVAASAATPPAQDPFADNNGVKPPAGSYRGPLFKLSHRYPDTLPPEPASYPWRAAIGSGRITVRNAAAYVAALKAHIVDDMRAVSLHYDTWDAGRRGWYNEPWVGSKREAIHGSYIGSSPFTPDLFPGTGLNATFDSYMVVYYDRRAAVTLFKTWGTTARNPVVNDPAATQFAEGSIIVKFAFSTANGDKWPVLQGALQWPLLFTTDLTDPSLQGKVGPASFFQFDLIVKDAASAPHTGWVFATLVYDQDAPGGDVWDKMVPLGAMWGNDPDIDSSQANPPPLAETWINGNAPAYSKMNLGWGGRLAGPNDGARGPASFISDSGKKTDVASAQYSSCMSCHGVSQWPRKSPLIPIRPDPAPAPGDDETLLWNPGSPEWMQWFRSRPGNVPQDAGSVAFDYDMASGFMSLNLWQEARTSPPTAAGAPHPETNYDGRRRRPAPAKK